MDELQAQAIADSLGGETWQSGGDMWLVLFRRSNGSIVALSDEVVCEYENEEALGNSEPSSSIILCG